jgi:hypothetical protein
MKNILFLLILFVFCYPKILAQDYNIESYRDNEPRKAIINTHDPNLKSFPEKSFYQQKADWQYIIDTTWGPGLPLAQKQQIFNTFTSNIRNSFDGFQSLGMSLAIWDSIKNYYYSQINSTTSRGRFAAIMDYLCSNMRDGHTYCDDIALYATPLNPGVPFFMFGGLIINANHFGAVTTVLPDSSVLILRVVNNHPLNLEPGDIILGYEGVPWKDLIVELMEAELPNFDWWGGYDGTFTDHLFIGAGMNWHLFDTIDVLKYSSGDTVHLSVAPMVNLNVPAMANNEQMEISNIPFPNFSSGQYVSYGILNNTNIGYIFTYSEGGSGNSQFDQAVAALQNTEALIIDMRWNTGGTTGWSGAFKILANESFPTLEFAPRCNSSDFTLCPNGSVGTCFVSGSGTGAYDRPIAVLLGPNCISTGDRNAYRLKYLYNVRTFGRPTWSSLGSSVYPTYSGWDMRVSSADMLHTNNPGIYLNRREFPIDFPVWHNRDDAAIGKDAVVEKALDWINYLVYPHSTFSDKTYYSPSEDSVHLFTTIENPNVHQLSARAYLKTVEGTLIDSVDLVKQSLNAAWEQWTADLNLPPAEEFYKIALTVFDETSSDYFSVPNATRFTTVGPVVLDSISWTIVSTYYSVKPFLKNQSTATTITNASVRLICNDPWVTLITPVSRTLPNIPPGSIVSPTSPFTVTVNNSIFPGYFNFKVEVMSNEWIYWTDSMQVVVPVEITSFTATVNGKSVILNWSTATELNNQGFEIERSEDNISFNKIGFVPGFGTTTEPKIYSYSDQSVNNGTYYYRLKQVDYDGSFEYSNVVEVDYRAFNSYLLEQNFPNPFNPTTTIGFGIQNKSNVKITILNAIGEEVAVVLNEEKDLGYHTVEFNAASLPSGVYFYRLQAGIFVQTKKMILLK